MSLIKYAMVAFALLLTSATFAMPAAQAQGTVVIVIDEAKILRDSRAGKDLATKLKNIETQMKNELDPTRRSLETEGKSLQTRAEGKTREAIAADTALVASLTSYQQKANDFAQKRAKASQELQLTERKALIEFNRILEPILMEVVREKNAGIVMSRGAVVYSTDATDVTQSVISKLDSRTPSITVTRERLPTQSAN